MKFAEATKPHRKSGFGLHQLLNRLAILWTGKAAVNKKLDGIAAEEEGAPCRQGDKGTYLLQQGNTPGGE
jgi:hypothetical protein